MYSLAAYSRIPIKLYGRYPYDLLLQMADIDEANRLMKELALQLANTMNLIKTEEENYKPLSPIAQKQLNTYITKAKQVNKLINEFIDRNYKQTRLDDFKS